MPTIELKTADRSTYPNHIVFLSCIKDTQPDKEATHSYFGDHHWQEYLLEECVAYGLQLAEEKDCVFTWLTPTNRGAGVVCQAALNHAGISQEDLAGGYLCDPTSKSAVRILARRGLLM